MFNPHQIRRDFPLIYKLGKENRLIYLDNAATTHKPLKVIEAVSNFYLKEYSNIHRGDYKLSRRATELYEEAHKTVARHIGASWDEIIFSFNSTISANMLAIPLHRSMIKNGRRKIVTSIIEHHSNLLPWIEAAKTLGGKIDYLGVGEDGVISLRDAEEKIDEETGIVAITHVSNVTGVVQPVKEIFRIAKKAGAITVLDAAQSMPHIPINVGELMVDIMFFSGHKMMAPTGTGGFYGKRQLLEELEPHIVGGGVIREVSLDNILFDAPPYRFEAGTPNIGGAIGLMEAVKYIEEIGKKNIVEHEKKLALYTRERLKENPRIVLYPQKPAGEITGIVTFNIKGIHPSKVGKILDEKYNIAVRAGKHCAHPYHKVLKAEKGTVRASYYVYNTMEEAERLIEAINSISGGE